MMTDRHLYGTVLTKQMPNHIQGCNLINQRIMIQLKIKKDPAFVIQIYTPDSSYSNDEGKNYIQPCSKNLIACQEKEN